MQNIGNFNIFDRHENRSLDEIGPLHERARSLLVRNRGKPLLKTGFMTIIGAIEMLAGLEYHHRNFEVICNGLAGWQSELSLLDHEIVAYFNRLGQFYYFARSSFVAQAALDYKLVVPTLLKYIIFRNKFSSHRSLDAPRGETEDEKVAHGRALTSSFGMIWTPRPGMAPALMPSAGPDGKIAIDVFEAYQLDVRTRTFPSYQTFDADLATHVTFTLQAEHPVLAAEAYALLEQVILFE